MLDLSIPVFLANSLRFILAFLLGLFVGHLIVQLLWTYRVLYKEIRYAKVSTRFLPFLEEQARLMDASAMRARQVLDSTKETQELADEPSSDEKLESTVLLVEEKVTELELTAQLFRGEVEAYKKSVLRRRVLMDALRARYDIRARIVDGLFSTGYVVGLVSWIPVVLAGNGS